MDFAKSNWLTEVNLLIRSSLSCWNAWDSIMSVVMKAYIYQHAVKVEQSKNIRRPLGNR